VSAIKITQGPSFYKGIELLPTGTKIAMLNKVWMLTQEKRRYRLEYHGETVSGRTYISFTKTDILKRHIAKETP
jgi:hypothetical protein